MIFPRYSHLGTPMPMLRFGDCRGVQLLRMGRLNTCPLAMWKEALQKAYPPVRPHDAIVKSLYSPHAVLSEAAEPIVASFEVRCDRKVVVAEGVDLPHTVRQEAKFSPSFVLLPAPIHKHVYPGASGFHSERPLLTLTSDTGKT